MLMTSAPWSAAQRTPLAMSSYAPLPSSSTLTGMILASGATPAMPTPLLVAAAAMPDTWVPCASFGLPDAVRALPVAVAARRVAADERGARRRACREVLVGEVDAGVDHGDHRAGTRAGRPRLLGVHLLRSVLLGVERVVRRGGAGGGRRQRDR
jgi:hypothetical protein